MSGISDELRDKIRLAISAPGHFLQRGDDYTESFPAWATRAVVSLLEEEGVSTGYASTEGAQVGPVQTTVHADTSVPGGAR